MTNSPRTPDDKDTVAYRANTGRDPRNLPDDHPDVWQWKYRGTKAERDRLEELMGLPRAVEEHPMPTEAKKDCFERAKEKRWI